MIENNKTILIVSPSDKLGGAEQFLLNIAKEYSRQGYVVDVFFLIKPSNDFWKIHKNVNVYYTTKSRESFGLLSFLKMFLKSRKKYFLSFSSHQHINSLLSILRRSRILETSKLIVRESTSVYLRYSKPKLLFYEFLYCLYNKDFLDLVICQSEDMKKQLLEGNKKFKDFKIEVVANPIDIDFVIKKSKEYIDAPKQFILAVGRLHPIKGFGDLIKAYAMSGVAKTHKLLILGEGPEKAFLQTLIVDLKLEDHVLLLGHVSNVFPYMKSASVGVISSYVEGFPNVLLQMYTLNLKVVTTNCCGGLSGFPNISICKVGDVQCLANKIVDAINENTVYDNRSFMEQFDLKNFPNKILNLL